MGPRREAGARGPPGARVVHLVWRPAPQRLHAMSVLPAGHPCPLRRFRAAPLPTRGLTAGGRPPGLSGRRQCRPAPAMHGCGRPGPHRCPAVSSAGLGRPGMNCLLGHPSVVRGNPPRRRSVVPQRGVFALPGRAGLWLATADWKVCQPTIASGLPSTPRQRRPMPGTTKVRCCRERRSAPRVAAETRKWSSACCTGRC